MNETIFRWSRGTLPVMSLRVLMGGLRYGFQIKYNARSDTWDLDMFAPSGDLLASSVPAYTGLRMLEGLGIEGLPPGNLFVRKVSETSDREHPGRDGWREGFEMVYQEPAQ